MSSSRSTVELAGLLGLCAAGDHAAFEQVYDEIAPRGFGLAMRVLRDPAQAEEVAQEALLEIWRTAGRYDPQRGTPLAWMLTIVHRRAVDRVRSSGASSRRDTSYVELSRPADEQDPTGDLVQASLEASRVRTALQALPSLQREALVLAFFDGHTHSEVARLLDLPIGTAKSRIRSGLLRLREALRVPLTPSPRLIGA